MALDSQTILLDVLRLLGMPDARVEVLDHPEGKVLDVHCDEPGRLIGRQGKTLSSLQFIVNRIAFQQDREAPKFTLDVGGYREKIRDELVARATEGAKRVSKWGDPVEFEPMNSYERRIVHNVLKDNPDVETASVEVDGTTRKAMILRRAS